MITYCLAVFSCYREEKDGKRESCKLIDEKTELDVSVKVKKKKKKYLDSLRGLFFLLCAIEENQLSSTVTASFFLFLRKFF